MNRCRYLLSLGLFLLAARISRAESAPVAPPEPAIVTTALHGGVYLMTGRGGNIAAFPSASGVLLIDDQFKERTALIQQAVAEITPQPIRWVINTHYHFDHTGGNENLGAAGAIFISQANARRRMATGERIEVFKMDQPPTKPVGLPMITFTRDLTLHRGDETIEIVAGFPAHTDGDAMVIFRKANVVHTGDVFVRYGWPFLDTMHGGSLDGTIRACEYLLGRPDINDDTQIIPGHGALARKSDLATYAANLRIARDRIAELLNDGKTQEQILAADPLQGIDFKETSIKKDVFVILALESMRRERSGK